MPLTVIRYEDTPNPNAMKCWLSGRVSEGPRSFLNAASADGDPLAKAIFEQAQATTLLFLGDWMTVNKRPEARWPAVKRAIEKALAAQR
jgi:hypothetical protein